MSNFKIGKKVVCVDGSRPQVGDYPEAFPIEGCIYTIRGFEIGRGDEIGEIGVVLEEIVNPPREFVQGCHELSFKPERFRPLVSKSVEAGMDVLRKLCKGKKQRAMVE
jgi:hypothetical protein